MAVVVAGSPGDPVVLDRRRIEIADASIHGSKQPFHAAEPLPFAEADALVRRCRESSRSLAESAVRDIVATHAVTAAGLLCGSARPLPALAAILKSHALIHTAEGEMFREVLAEAIEQRGLLLTRIQEKEVWQHGAAVFGIPDLRERIDSLKKAVGAPWSQDEKLAALAAWMALAQTAAPARIR